jgi:hypothetical protein
MQTRISVALAIVMLFVAAGSAIAADGESAQVQVAEPVSGCAVTREAEAQPVEQTVPDAWVAEREKIERLRAEAGDQIDAIEVRLQSEDLSGEERASLHREVGDIKIGTEIRVQEIRLSVAEERGMTRHVEEIRQALECLRNLDAPEEAGVVDRPESAPAPGKIVEPDQG